MPRRQEFIDRWHEAVAAKDPAAIERLLAPGFTLYSPVAHKPYTERSQVLAILAAVLRVLPDLTYVRREPLLGGALMIFRGTTGGLAVEGMDLFDLDPDGRAVRLTVMVRPLRALAAFAERMAQELG